MKREKLGKVSKSQAERHAELDRAGIPVHVVTSVSDALNAVRQLSVSDKGGK